MQRIFTAHTLASTAAALALLSGALGVGCSSTDSTANPAGERYEFDEPSGQLARQIDVKAIEAEMWREDLDFVRLCDWFYSVGEPAYETLIAMAAGSSPKARQVAMSVISLLEDRRLLRRFNEDVPVPEDTGELMTYARTLLTLGDYSQAMVLVEALDDSNARNRALAHQALERATNNAVPFEASWSEEERAPTIDYWRRWVAAQTGDSMLVPEDEVEQNN